jgi:hypothetical protein
MFNLFCILCTAIALYGIGKFHMRLSTQNFVAALKRTLDCMGVFTIIFVVNLAIRLILAIFIQSTKYIPSGDYVFLAGFSLLEAITFHGWTIQQK